MSDHVFVVSEWQPKDGKDQELWQRFKQLMQQSKSESGCVRAHATRQIKHPGSPSESPFTIVLLQEYIDVSAFDAHCAEDYVTGFFNDFIENESTALVEDWRCRLFTESE